MSEGRLGKENNGSRPAEGCGEPGARAAEEPLPPLKDTAEARKHVRGAGAADANPAGQAPASLGSGTAFDPELRPDDIPAPLDAGHVYGLAGPLVVEIGCGKGRYLLARAAASPSVPFLGIEYAAKYLRIMKERAAKRGLRNVRVVRTEAASFIERFLSDGSVRELHVYFPDPWPKRRHHKRRLFSPDFVSDILRALTPGGTVYFATDFTDYFRIVADLLKTAFEVEVLAGPWPDSPFGRTNYEMKYMAEGRPIMRAIARKRG